MTERRLISQKKAGNLLYNLFPLGILYAGILFIVCLQKIIYWLCGLNKSQNKCVKDFNDLLTFKLFIFIFYITCSEELLLITLQLDHAAFNRTMNIVAFIVAILLLLHFFFMTINIIKAVFLNKNMNNDELRQKYGPIFSGLN